MQLTKGAIGNLINRYKAVLKKCHLMNTFGSLAVAACLVMGGAGVAAGATDRLINDDTKTINGDSFDSTMSINNGGAIYNTANGTLTVNGATFKSNKATNNGGAIYNNGTLTVNGATTTFNSNTANNYGGAIHNSGTLNVAGATFNRNGANVAGAIFNTGTLVVNSGSFRVCPACILLYQFSPKDTGQSKVK